MEFLLQPEVLPFSVALTVMLIIALIEGVGTMMGMGVSGLLDNMLPDLDLPDIDIDVDLDVDGDISAPATLGTDIDTPSALGEPGAFGKFLAWLQVGKVPVLILMIVFLVGFGLSGLILQQVLLNATGFMLPALLASVPAFLFALPFTRTCGAGVGKVMPKDETDAISADTFVGRVATLTLGKATYNNSGRAKVQDQHGKTHYILVAPDQSGITFKKGEQVLLVKKNGTIFQAIRNENKALAD